MTLKYVSHFWRFTLKRETVELDQKQERNLQFCFSVCTPAKKVALVVYEALSWICNLNKHCWRTILGSETEEINSDGFLLVNGAAWSNSRQPRN
jgi:hypothetical protein